MKFDKLLTYAEARRLIKPQPMYQPTNQPINQSINQSTKPLHGCPLNSLLLMYSPHLLEEEVLLYAVPARDLPH
jgi:hypothetical protein